MKARTLSPLVVLFLVLAGGRLTLSQSPPATAKPAFPPNDPVTRAMTEAGKLLFSWGTFGQFPGGFWGVHQFSVDSDGNLYTADVHVGRPQKFRPKPGASRDQLVGAPMPLARK